MSPIVKLVIFILVALFSGNKHSVAGYARGAPVESCADMAPQHGPVAQTTTAPYLIIPQQNKIEQGGTVQVSIGGRSPRDKFMGFLLIAVNPTDPSLKPLGRFINSPYTARTLDCRPEEQNALTHRDSHVKEKLELTWKAPSNYQGDIEFRCTFLRDFMAFWVHVPAENLVHVGNVAVAAPTTGAASSSGSSSSVSLVPMVTLFDYFVWRFWFGEH